MIRQVNVRHLGQQPYEAVWQQMKSFTEERDESTFDEIWLLEHLPVFTQGQAGKAEHVLAPGDIPVVKSDRGGQVTYHGPGQLVVYLLLDIRRLSLGVRDLVTIIEQVVVRFLASHGIEGTPRKEAPGVYVDGRKVAQLGLRVRRGASYHGLSLNVDMDLEPFSRINPCGYKGLEVIDLKQLGMDITLEQVGQQISALLCDEFGYDAQPVMEVVDD